MTPSQEEEQLCGFVLRSHSRSPGESRDVLSEEARTSASCTHDYEQMQTLKCI